MLENHNDKKYSKYKNDNGDDEQREKYRITEEQQEKDDAQYAFEEQYKEKTNPKTQSRSTTEDQKEPSENKDAKTLEENKRSTSKSSFAVFIKNFKTSAIWKRALLNLRELFKLKAYITEEEIKAIQFKRKKILSGSKNQRQKLLERIAHLSYIQEYIQEYNTLKAKAKHDKAIHNKKELRKEQQPVIIYSNSDKNSYVKPSSITLQASINSPQNNKDETQQRNTATLATTRTPSALKYFSTQNDIYHRWPSKAQVNVSNNFVLRIMINITNSVFHNLTQLAQNMIYNAAYRINTTIHFTLALRERANSTAITDNNNPGQYTEPSKLPTSYISITTTHQALENIVVLEQLIKR